MTPTPMKPTLAAMVVMIALANSARAADDAKFYPPQGWAVAKQANGTRAVQPPGSQPGK